MQGAPPGSRPVSAAPIDAPVHRFSQRLQELPPELGPFETVTTAVVDAYLLAAGSTAAHYTLQTPQVPKVFHRDPFEDVEDWLLHSEHVAAFNQWDNTAKLCNVYFSLENGARTWFENREHTLTSWQEFHCQLLSASTRVDYRERAEHALYSRIHLPNESVQVCVEDMTCLFRRPNPATPEDKKLRT